MTAHGYFTVCSMGCHGTDYTEVVCYFTVCSMGCHGTDYTAVVRYFTSIQSKPITIKVTD
jgi:hypothetical protein